MIKHSKDIEDFRNSFKNKKIPVLTLDTRWHELFPEYDKPVSIKALEEQLNNLLKRQGKLTYDMKDLKTLKKQLMAEIVQNMDTDTPATRSKNEKKLNRNRTLIQEINDKLMNCEEELGNIPYHIKAVNEELMVQSMSICYDRLQNYQHNIESLNAWIHATREEIKEKILLKQDLESKSTTMYSYMHDMLGAQIMEIFDKNQESKEHLEGEQV